MRELWILLWWWMLMVFSPWLNSYDCFGWSFIRELYSFMSGQSSQDKGRTAPLTYGKGFLCAPILYCLQNYPLRNEELFSVKEKKTKNIWRALILLLTIKCHKFRPTTQDNCLLGFFHILLPLCYPIFSLQNLVKTTVTSQRIEWFYLNRETDNND